MPRDMFGFPQPRGADAILLAMNNMAFQAAGVETLLLECQIPGGTLLPGQGGAGNSGYPMPFVDNRLALPMAQVGGGLASGAIIRIDVGVLSFGTGIGVKIYLDSDGVIPTAAGTAGVGSAYIQANTRTAVTVMSTGSAATNGVFAGAGQVLNLAHDLAQTQTLAVTTGAGDSQIGFVHVWLLRHAQVDQPVQAAVYGV
jgi:hypothetical protein